MQYILIAVLVYLCLLGILLLKDNKSLKDRVIRKYSGLASIIVGLCIILFIEMPVDPEFPAVFMLGFGWCIVVFGIFRVYGQIQAANATTKNTIDSKEKYKVDGIWQLKD